MFDLEEKIAASVAHTAMWAKSAGWPIQIQAEASPLSEAAERVQKMLNDISFGCQQENVRKLVCALLGEELPAPSAGWQPKSRRYDPPAGAFIFTDGEARRVTDVDSDRDVFVIPIGDASYYSPGSYRPAGESEIRDYYTKAVAGL